MIDEVKVTYFASDLDEVYLALRSYFSKIPSDRFSGPEQAENRTLRGLARGCSGINLWYPFSGG